MNPSHPSDRASGREQSLEPLIDEREYSRLTGRSVASIRRDRRLGLGCPYVKLGSLVRYRPEDVRAYIESNKRGRDAK